MHLRVMEIFKAIFEFVLLTNDYFLNREHNISHNNFLKFFLLLKNSYLNNFRKEVKLLYYNKLSARIKNWVNGITFAARYIINFFSKRKLVIQNKRVRIEFLF